MRPNTDTLVQKNISRYSYPLTSLSLKLLALGSDHVVAQTCHPETPFYGTLSRLKVVLGTGVDEPKKALDDCSGGPITLKVDQWLPVSC